VHVCLFSTFSLSGCFTYAWEVHVNRSLPEGKREGLSVCVCAHIHQAPSVRSLGFLETPGVCEGRQGGRRCVSGSVPSVDSVCVCVRVVPGQEVEQHGDASPAQTLCSISDSPLLTCKCFSPSVCVCVHNETL